MKDLFNEFQTYFSKSISYVFVTSSRLMNDLRSQLDAKFHQINSPHKAIQRLRRPYANSLVPIANVSVKNESFSTSSPWNTLSYNDESNVNVTTPEGMDAEQLKEFTQRQHIANVDIMGTESDNMPTLRRLLTVKTGGKHSEHEISIDVQRLMMTGDFSNVGIKMDKTSEGLNVVYLVEPYFELTRVKVTGTRLLTRRMAEDMFHSQTGRKMNLNQIFGTLARMEKWYFEQKKDITFDIMSVEEDHKNGVLTLKLAEISIANYKLTDMYRSMRTDIISMRILAAEKT